MPAYQYKGLNSTGKEVKGVINSEGMQQAKAKVKTMGIMLLDIKEKKAKAQGGGGGLLKKVSVQDLAIMTRQLATLIKAKIQVVDAFSALEDQVDNDYLKLVLGEIKKDVNEGSALAKAMQKHPKVFSNVYINMVEAGEASGTLEVVLLRLADFTEAQLRLKNKISSAMVYPIIMLSVGFVMISGILIFVIPKIAKIFTSMKKELPPLTKLMISLSEFMVNYWYLVLIGLVTGYFAIKKFISTPKGQAIWHRWQLKLPIMGNLVVMINVSRFCSTLATLLNSGVPIIASMNIVKNLIPNVHMKAAVDRAKESVSEGRSIVTPLIESGHYPSMVTHMIALGEKSGELEDMLGIISTNYEDQVENKLSGLTSVLEPLMMVFMGLAVATIVFAVVIPMMDMSSLKR